MSCDDVLPAFVWPEAKDPDDIRDYAVDFEQKLIRFREKGKSYELGTRVRPTKAMGLEAECTTAGQTGSGEPRWPSIAGLTISDGSVVWTMRAISNASLVSTIVGIPTWTADAGVTATGLTIVDHTAIADLSGGIDSDDYTVLVKALLANGKTITAVCVLKVRRGQRVCEA